MQPFIFEANQPCSLFTVQKDLVHIGKSMLMYCLLCAATLAMLLAIVQYTGFRTDVGFLRFKQDYLHITVWRVAFYTHVFSSIFTLLAGFTQFSHYVLKEHRGLHRFMGRAYAWNILLINFPAGMIMAFYANGHLPSKLAFIILDCLWFWSTYKGVVAIRAKDITAHKRFMIRSYALTCSAITLRTWKIILSHSFTIDPQVLYMIDAWMGFVPNLIFAEWLIMRLGLQQKRSALKSEVLRNNIQGQG